MARNLLKICANLVAHLKKVLFSDEFLSRNRNSPHNFSRTRLLPFPTVILFLLNLLKSALQVELNYFFKAIQRTATAVQTVTASAFCQARKKLRYQAFVELNREQVAFFYQHFPVRRWHDFRLLTIDGSTLHLPSIDDLINHFGGCSEENHSPLARVSQLYDTLNQITLDAVISPHSTGERELASRHMDYLQDGDLVLLDRGYAAFWFFALIRSHAAHFCARMPIDQWDVVQRFVQSGQKEAIVTMQPSPHSDRKCRENEISYEPLTVRLIRVELENGDVEILMTSLLDTDFFPHELFGTLYQERWGIEEHYKTMKHRLQMENYTGKSYESIYQDFHARVFTLNLTNMLVHPAQDSVIQASASYTYSYQVNLTKALSFMKDSIVLLFVRSSIGDLLDNLLNLFRKNTEPIRPNRKYPRKRRIRNRQTFSYPYKQTR